MAPISIEHILEHTVAAQVTEMVGALNDTCLLFLITSNQTVLVKEDVSTEDVDCLAVKDIKI